MKGSDASIRRTRQGSLEALVVENEVLRLTVVPELGGKIVSLIRRETGREYLLQPSRSHRRYRTRSYADSFEDYEPGGFDECLPTIAESVYPEEPFRESRLPDHGDVWCLPTAVELAGGELGFTTALRSLPLRFRKQIGLRANSVRLDYEATNLSPSTVKFLWSAHPLLRVEPGAEIILPKAVNEVEIAWSNGERMGKPGDRCPWPEARERSGRKVKLNRVDSPSADTAEKLFTPRLSEGFCSMFLPREDESIAFRFDCRLVPYVGIWICQGGWPPGRAARNFTVALEPSLGRPDSLADAIRHNQCAVLASYGSMRWWMEMEVNAGCPPSRGREHE